MPRGDALWYAGQDRVELRTEQACAPGAGDVCVAARFSGISRGTERLIFSGRVPASEYQRMRCPHQAGDFPFPVKYGYALVGEVEQGPASLMGKSVFLLHPHQRKMCVPAGNVHVIPEGVPLKRAALAANIETALNVTWDSGAAPGDKVLVVGGGVLGLLTAAIIAGIPGTTVTVADVDPTRAPIAAKLGAAFTLPDAAPRDQDIVIHTSSTAAGLQVALASAGTEARVVEASWYGDKDVAVPLGEAFHARRLQLISSQVGAVPPARRARWTTARRMASALSLLRDSRFDALITGEIAFDDAVTEVPKVLSGGSAGLMTVLRYT